MILSRITFPFSVTALKRLLTFTMASPFKVLVGYCCWICNTDMEAELLLEWGAVDELLLDLVRLLPPAIYKRAGVLTSLPLPPFLLVEAPRLVIWVELRLPFLAVAPFGPSPPSL